jgi:TPR repeat protein
MKKSFILLLTILSLGFSANYQTKAMNYFNKGNYKKACDLNSPEGYNSLGIAYEKGLGTEIDLIKARETYAKSCRWGYQKGCANFNRISQNKNTNEKL